ncbi:phosphotransferase [Nocardioides fonticola]|uniref:Phosphotransferase n=1 Tax=Nocardioides fonticola TaxID=450363 RepID=A0ABP7XAM6_9ACTN
MEHDLSAGDAVLERIHEVARAAAARHGRGDAEVVLLNVSENATFRLSDDHGSAALRVHRRGYHAPGAIATELAWQDALREEAGIRTPHVLATPAGERIVEVPDPDGEGPRSCVLFEFLPGAEPTGDLAGLAAIAARMHRHARGWAGAVPGTRFAWDLSAAFGPEMRWGDWREAIGLDAEGRGVLQRAEDAVRARLADVGRDAASWGLIHGDMRRANLLEHEGALAVIDFDDCGFGWYGYDLAAALSFIEHTPQAPDLVASWFEGYATVAPPAALDLDLATTFVMFRRLLLTAWIASHRPDDPTGELGADFTAGTCRLAEEYLAGRGAIADAVRDRLPA